MKQSRSTSLLKSVISTGAGFGISLAAQWLILPLLGVSIAFHQNIEFAIIMTAISIARGFVLERIFEHYGLRQKLSPFVLAGLAERKRQITDEGWDAVHDDEHRPGELAEAGAAYAKQASLHLEDGYDLMRDKRMFIPNFWPWPSNWWKPTDFRRDLVKAFALIVAEGEKLDRSRKAGKRRSF